MLSELPLHHDDILQSASKDVFSLKRPATATASYSSDKDAPPGSCFSNNRVTLLLVAIFSCSMVTGLTAGCLFFLRLQQQQHHQGDSFTPSLEDTSPFGPSDNSNAGFPERGGAQPTNDSNSPQRNSPTNPAPLPDIPQESTPQTTTSPTANTPTDNSNDKNSNKQKPFKLDEPENKNMSTKRTWPELVGEPGEQAKETIQQENPSITAVFLVPEGNMVTMDFRTDRVRIFVKPDGTVAKAPRVG